MCFQFLLGLRTAIAVLRRDKLSLILIEFQGNGEDYSDRLTGLLIMILIWLSISLYITRRFFLRPISSNLELFQTTCVQYLQFLAILCLSRAFYPHIPSSHNRSPLFHLAHRSGLQLQIWNQHSFPFWLPSQIFLKAIFKMSQENQRRIQVLKH